MEKMSVVEKLFNGIKVVEDSDDLYDQEQQRLREAQKILAYEKSGVGEMYWDMTLDDVECGTEEDRRNLDTVKGFIEDVNQGIPRTLWLCGANGNGKTLLASLIIRECGGHFSRSYNIEDELSDAGNYKNRESRTDVFERYKQYSRVLAIDEVGRFPSDSELKFLFHILNDRYENDRSTVIVTNLPKEKLKEYLGRALVDRFVTNCTTLIFSGESRRVKGRLEEMRHN